MLAVRYLGGVALLSSAIVFLSCSDSPTENEAQRIPAALNIVSGDEQEGTVGEELPDPLVVRVEDENGLPVLGQLVNFRVTSGGGSVFAGSGLTNALGVVQDRWTLGTSTAQAQRVEARAVDPNTGAAIVFATFTAIPLPGPAHSVTKAEGDGQSGMLGAALPESLAVRVTDRYGNPVPGVTVAWAVSAANGTVSPSTSQTNAQGIAKTRWTLGSRLDVPHGVTATVGALTPAAFAVTATLPSTATIVKVAGDGASGTVGAAMADSLAVRVQLEGGEPVAGATVTWNVTGGGSTSPGSSTTQSDGVARTRLTLGTVAGAYVVTAGVPGISPAVITVTGSAGTAATVTKIGGDGQTGTVAEPLAAALSIRVLDQYGNAVPNVAVTWTPSAGTSAPGAASTDANGEASATWTLGQSVGSHTLSAAVSGAPAAEFTAIARAGAVSSLTVVGGGGQLAIAGSTLPTSVTVHARDAFGNSVSDASITFAASDGGSFSPATAATDAIGNASARWTLGPTAGTQTATLSSGSVTVTTTAAATTGTAALLAVASGNGQAGIAGDPLAQPLVVRVTDANLNPVSGVVVTWSAGTQCGEVSPASSTTDASGLTQASWTLGASGRLCSGGVTVNLSGGASVTFTARFLGRTAQLLDPGNFVERVGTIDVPVVLTAVVTDGAENPVPGVSVSWNRTEGNGSLATTSSVTDSMGRASATFTPGSTAGDNRVTANVTGVAPAEYLVWTPALAAERVVLAGGNNQSGEPGQALANSIQVRVEDKYGNGVYNESVTFAVTAGGGYVERTTLRTDPTGLAGTVWVPGSVGGQEARATWNSSSVTFAATGIEGAREGMIIVGGNEQVATTSFQREHFLAPLTVRVVNGRGEPVSGVPVTWSHSSTAVVSDASGLSTLSNARVFLLGVGTIPVTATLPNGIVARFTAIVESGGGGSFASPSHTGLAAARVGRRLPGRVVVICSDRMGGASGCTVRTRDANFVSPAGEIIPAPGIFPPGHYEYFWILPSTPGTYYFEAAGLLPNAISATAVP
jgi:adhesin/invasin